MTQDDSNDALAPIPTQTERDYLTLQDISARCHVSYKTVRQFADKECVQEFMCAYKHPSSKGFRWPLDCEPKWRMLLDTAQKGLIQPLNVAAWLQNLEMSGGMAQSFTMGNSPNAELTLSGPKAELTLSDALLPQSAYLTCDQQESLETLARALDRHTEALERMPAMEDALLTLAEARARYGLSLSTLRALSILEGGRRKVKVSVIRHKIAEL